MQAIMKAFAALAALMMVTCSMRAYGGQAEILAGVHRYSVSLAQFESGRSSKSLGEIYAEGRAVGNELADVLESLSDSDFALTETEMKGFFVFREESVGVLPRMMFFQELARRKGAKEDIDFFNFMVEVYGEGIWPAYFEQQTDYGGCESYGDGTRTRLYIDALKISPANQTYRTELRRMIDALKASLITDGACVCGEADSVTRELTLFVAKVPNAPFAGDVKSLMAKVKAGKSTMKFSCVAG